MGLWSDVISNGLAYGSAPITGGLSVVAKDAYDRAHAGVAPGATDPRRTDIAYSGKNADAKTLADSIFNDTTSRDYGTTFDTAYQNLGQPLHAPDRNELYTAGTRALANAFADRVYMKTGSLPTEDQVRQFVGQNLTPGFAQKFILGLAPDQINSMADEYIIGNPDALVNPGTIGAQKSAEEQRLSGLKDQLDKIYNTGRENLVSGYDKTVYAPAKTRAVNDLAGQGMLTNPNSRYTLDAIEASRGSDLASGLNQLEGQRATGNIDLSKTIEDLLQRNKDRSQNAYQFGKTFNAGRDDTFFNQGMQQRGLDLASTLGKLQAGNNKKDWSDYLNTALNVVGTGTKAYTAFK